MSVVISSKIQKVENTKKQILTEISEQTICQRYIGKYYPNNVIVPNLKIATPYDKRLDKVFCIYVRNNHIKWSDEGTKQKGDIFQLIRKTYRLNDWETLTMIDFDFRLGLIKNNHSVDKYEGIEITDDTVFFKNSIKTDAYFKVEEIVQRVIKYPEYQCKPSKITLHEYFETLGINKTTVNEYELFELEYGKVTTPKFDFLIKSAENYPLFAYRYGKQIKVFNPIISSGFAKFAHIGRKGSKYIFGLKQLKCKKSKIERLFLVSNEIDVIILSVNGYDAVCVCGGDTLLTKGLLKQLSFAETIIFLNTGNEEELSIAKKLKQNFNITSLNYQNLINNGTTKTFI